MSDKVTSRQDILDLLDNFVNQIYKIRKILLGVSVSALILAPLAIGLSLYLLRHPSFFTILEMRDEFGLALSILLASVITISSIWLVTGIRQYLSVRCLNEKYDNYMKEKDEIDRQIASKFGLDED